MAQDALKQWYIAGLHAYRSASEQAKEAAVTAEEKSDSSELKTYSRDVAALCDRQETTMVAFLKELDTEPNSFKDRIQEGIIKGTEMAVKAAEEPTSRDIALHFGTRAGLMVDRLHGVGVDAGPDAMRMASALLFMKDDHSWLTSQAQLGLDIADRFLEFTDWNVRRLGRAQAKGKQELLAFRTLADRIGFAKCTPELVGDKAPHLMQFDMVIFIRPLQVDGKLRRSPALATFQDHARTSGLKPSARIRRSRISRTS